jgi:hypothetical protein
MADKLNPADEIRKMSPQEFQELGILQEVNRQFLHPLGLALEVTFDPSIGEFVFGEVWDYRSDPEGIIFGDGVLGTPESLAKWEYVHAELRKHQLARERLFHGQITQPIRPETNQ